MISSKMSSVVYSQGVSDLSREDDAKPIDERLSCSRVSCSLSNEKNAGAEQKKTVVRQPTRTLSPSLPGETSVRKTAAVGSSSASWYGSRYGCARASSTVILFFGLNVKHLSRRSIASGFAFGYRDWNGRRFLKGRARR